MRDLHSDSPATNGSHQSRYAWSVRSLVQTMVSYMGWDTILKFSIFLIAAAYLVLVVRPYETAPFDQADRTLLEKQFAWPIVLNETFTFSTEITWMTGVERLNKYTVERSIRGGTYLWQVTPHAEVTCCRSEALYLIPIGSIDNFLLSVDIQKGSGDKGMSYGILYHYVDRDNHYEISFNDIGHLSVDMWNQGEWEPIYTLSPRLESVIRPFETNNLMLSVHDGHTMVFLNGVYACQFDDNRVEQGAIALMVKPYGLQPYTEIHFDNIVVRKPEP